MIFVVKNRIWRAIVQFSSAGPAMQVLIGSPPMFSAFQELVACLPGGGVPARLLTLSGITVARITFIQFKVTDLHIPALWNLKQKMLTGTYHQGHHFYYSNNLVRPQSQTSKAFSKSIKFCYPGMLYGHNSLIIKKYNILLSDNAIRT